MRKRTGEDISHPLKHSFIHTGELKRNLLYQYRTKQLDLGRSR